MQVTCVHVHVYSMYRYAWASSSRPQCVQVEHHPSLSVNLMGDHKAAYDTS